MVSIWGFLFCNSIDSNFRMTYFFDEDPSVTRFVPHNKTAEISDTDELCRNIAKCIREMDPDILFLEEGPSTKAQMDLFNSTYLNDEFIVIGGLENVTQQLYLLCRRNGPISQPTLHAKVRKLFFHFIFFSFFFFFSQVPRIPDKEFLLRRRRRSQSDRLQIHAPPSGGRSQK